MAGKKWKTIKATGGPKKGKTFKVRPNSSIEEKDYIAGGGKIRATWIYV